MSPTRRITQTERERLQVNNAVVITRIVNKVMSKNDFAIGRELVNTFT